MTNHYTDVCEETIKSLRQQLDAASEDTRRLDFMEAFGGEHIAEVSGAASSRPLD